MDAPALFGFAALIVMILPVVVLPWEGRRPPGAIYVAIALSGLCLAWVRSGAAEAAWAGLAGAGTLVAISLIVATVRTATGLQVLSGGQIKLLSSGGIWLGVSGSLTMMALSGISILLIGFLYRSKGIAGKPDSGAVVAAAILCVGFGKLMQIT